MSIGRQLPSTTPMAASGADSLPATRTRYRRRTPPLAGIALHRDVVLSLALGMEPNRQAVKKYVADASADLTVRVDGRNPQSLQIAMATLAARVLED